MNVPTGGMTQYDCLDTPAGTLTVVAERAGVRQICFSTPAAGPGWQRGGEFAAEAVRQLRAYFAGELQRFDLPLAPAGTPFQQRVWTALTAIPFGETISYGQLARRLDNPAASRAVGLANGANPIPIVIPCHRVIGSSGKLTGYGGGLETKRRLLEFERRQMRLAFSGC